MKNTRKLCLASMAALSLGVAVPLSAQTTQSGTRAPDVDSTTTLQTTRPLSADHTLGTLPENAVGKVNKASGLIGMDVRNPENQKLGEIKDLVVDLHSGKIAYAVLSVGGFLGIGDKYVAVPPSAFSVAPEQDRLVLNADKVKIQNAPSFAKTSWPDLHSPAWTTESSYWMSDTAQGTVGTSRIGTGTGSVTPEHRTPEHYATPGIKGDSFRGQITAVNPEAGTMTVSGPSGTRDFKFSERPTITLQDNRNPRITDLKVGYPVVVGYHNNNGMYVADVVIRSDAPAEK